MAKIHAPFTDEQLDKLYEWQAGMVKANTPEGDMVIVPTHPFTCCGFDGCTRSNEHDEGVLIPETEGFVCPCGKYKQNWCYDFMVE